MRLVRFTTSGGSPIYINPEQVSLVEPYPEADESVVTHIKTINSSTTVTEPLESVVAKLIAKESPPIADLRIDNET